VRSAAAADVYNMYTTPTSQQCSSDVRVFVAADGELSQLTGRRRHSSSAWRMQRPTSVEDDHAFRNHAMRRQVSGGSDTSQPSTKPHNEQRVCHRLAPTTYCRLGTAQRPPVRRGASVTRNLRTFLPVQLQCLTVISAACQSRSLQIDQSGDSA